MMWLVTLPSAICYSIFHYHFFNCTASVLSDDRIRPLDLLWTFFLNFGIFFICTIWQFHLIVNWNIFLVLLLFETRILLKQSCKASFLPALLAVELGLAVNILLRSLFAVLYNIPLIAFDNNTTMPGNMMAYPILLGFLIAGVLLWIAGRFNLLKKLSLVLSDKPNLVFLLCLLIPMQIYLTLNLLVYYIPQNSLVLKLWSMKSSVFVLVGECLFTYLAIRMGQLSAYRTENEKARRLLAEERIREEELRRIAATDPLTGCENRTQGEKRLKKIMDAGGRFCLCFVDLNSLKAINDGCGHRMGDRYLLSVSRALRQICGETDSLFRYGGDEFLLLLSGVTVSQAECSLQGVQKRLEGESQTDACPFPMSISYGISSSEESGDFTALVRAADARMYEMKALKHI